MYASSIRLKQTGQRKSAFFSSNVAEVVERCRFGVRIEERFVVGTVEPLCEEAELLRPSRLLAAMITRGFDFFV